MNKKLSMPVMLDRQDVEIIGKKVCTKGSLN